MEEKSSLTRATSAAEQGAPWTILKLVTWSEGYFRSNEIDSPRLTAEILLSHALGIRRLDLYLQFDRPLNQSELASYKELIKRRAAKEPVAYITGNRGFWDSQFEVTSDVLIPRPETEILVEMALKIIMDKKRSEYKSSYDAGIKVLDLGTGSGAIIISLARVHPDLFCLATDVSIKAISVARINAINILAGRDDVLSLSEGDPSDSEEEESSEKIISDGNSTESAFSGVSFVAGSWFSPIRRGTRFDLIVSNPPYIPSREIPDLQPEVRLHEPHLALDGGSEGIDALKEIMESAPDYLEDDGILLMEMGFDQREIVRKEAAELSDFYEPPEFVKDLAGLDRTVLLRKKIKNIENKNKV